MRNKQHPWLLVGIGFLVVTFSGCVSAPNPRMSTVLGLPHDKKNVTRQWETSWPKHRTIGVIAMSDASGPEAAPAISPAMLDRLSRRIQSYVVRQCAVPKVEILPLDGSQKTRQLSTLLNVGKSNEVESLIVALFSSTEITEPATFGEARMMTQIQGTTTHNSALVELGLIDVGQKIVGRHTNGEATETLDRLAVPIGGDQPTLEEALDILRANAGQQALDKALPKFTESCLSA